MPEASGLASGIRFRKGYFFFFFAAFFVAKYLTSLHRYVNHSETSTGLDRGFS
jgi:hypothetical protein